MECNRSKRRGFLKGKLAMSFYKAAKPSSTTPQYKPSHYSSPSTASVGFIVNQERVIPQPKPNVSFVVPDFGHDSYAAKFDNLYGVAADEGVDLKAATYISCVQERFKL
ncbi:uncharacterized protein LOC132282270 [Cornus florida]|uniref:uncharacterized protein LOC132282270 n=1 Tax=Cornus florida TaxID=4283 RepID=UPI0028A29941|nr:uncharacterized protein LOC132282270 [Cornus florida]